MSTHEHSHDKPGEASACGHRHAPGETCASHAPKEDCCAHEHAHGAHGETHEHKDHSTCCGHDHDHGHGHHHHAAGEGEDREWTRRFVLFLEMLVLILWSGVLLYFYASGRIGLYLAPQFQMLALCGGLGLAVLGLFNWAMRASAPACGHDHSHDGCCDDDHEHEHGGHAHGDGHHHHEGGLASRVFGLFLLAFPVAAATALTPDQFSPKLIAQRMDASSNAPSSAGLKKRLGVADASKPISGYTIDLFNRVTTRNPKGQYELRVDFLYDLAYDPEVRAVVKGVPVETTGMLTRDKVNNPDGKRLRAVIMITSCCAADGRPYSIPIEFDGPAPQIEEMTWYKVTGTVEFGSERGNMATVLKNPAIVPTTRPSLFRGAM